MVILSILSVLATSVYFYLSLELLKEGVNSPLALRFHEYSTFIFVMCHELFLRFVSQS